MASLFSTVTEVALVNTTSNPGTIQLPRTTELLYRVITIKDISGKFQVNSLTLTTQSPDTFENGQTSLVLNTDSQYVTFFATNTNQWVQIGGTNPLSAYTSSIQVSSINGQPFYSTNPNNLVSTSLLNTTLISTINGLGTFGYISSSTGGGGGEVTSTNLTSTTLGLGTLGYISSTQLASSLQSTVVGLGTIGYISSVNLSNLVSTPFLDTTLRSSLIGLGAAGYISSTQLASSLQSTVVGLGTIGYISSVNLSNLVSTPFLDTTLRSSLIGLGAAGYISSTQLASSLQSTVVGLGTIGYISSVNLANLVSTPFLDTTLRSSLIGLGAAGYISSTQLASSLQSTVVGLGTIGYISSVNLANLVSTPYLDTALQSTVSSLLGPQYISSGNLLSTTADIVSNLLFVVNVVIPSTNTGLATLGYISSPSLTSTTIGLGTIGYISSVNLDNLVSTPYLDTTLQSTVSSLLGPQYISSGNLISTTIGLDATLANLLISFGTFLDETIVSTNKGLGTFGYISTAGGGLSAQDLESTVIGLGTAGYISTAGGGLSVSNLESTVIGLGTVGYISTGGQGIFSSVHINMIPENAPVFDSNAYIIAGFDPEPNPLALDVFGSARFLKNIYVGSTTTAIGSGKVVSPILNTNTVSTASALLSTIGFIDPVLSNTQYMKLSNGTLYLNNQPVGSGGPVQSTFFINSDNPITVPSYVVYTVDSNFYYDQAPWGTQTATLQELTASIGQFTLIDGNTRFSYTGASTKAFRITYSCGGNENTVSVNRPTFTFILETNSGNITYQTVNANEAAGASVSLFVIMNQGDTGIMVLRGLENYSFSPNDGNLYQVVIESVEQFTVNTFSTIQASSFSLMDQSTMTYKDITVSAGSLYIGGTLAGAAGGGGGGSGSNALTSLPSTISTFALFTSSLTASTMFVEDSLTVNGLTTISTFLQASTTVTFNLGVLNLFEAYGPTGFYGNFVASSLAASTASVADAFTVNGIVGFSTLLQASSIVTSSINVATTLNVFGQANVSVLYASSVAMGAQYYTLQFG